MSCANGAERIDLGFGTEAIFGLLYKNNCTHLFRVTLACSLHENKQMSHRYDNLMR